MALGSHAHLGERVSAAALAGGFPSVGCLHVIHHHPYATMSERSHFIYYQNITQFQSQLTYSV